MRLPLLVENLSLWVPQRQLLRSLSFKIVPGSVTCVLGPTGSGKTRLLETIAGLVADWSGEIILHGKSQSILRNRRRARLRGLLLPVDRYPFPLSVEQCVGLAVRGRRFAGFCRPKDWSDRVTRALQDCNLLEYRHALLTDLSSEIGRHVDFACLAAQDPRLWLLDEPNNYLSRESQATFLQRIVESIRESDAGCVMTLHDTGLAMRFADQVIMLTGQGTAIVGSPDRLLNLKVLGELTGRPVVDPDRDASI